MSKVKVKLSGQDGNIFNLIGVTSKAMKQAGQREKAIEMSVAVRSTHSYDEALQKIMEYADVS